MTEPSIFSAPTTFTAEVDGGSAHIHREDGHNTLAVSVTSTGLNCAELHAYNPGTRAYGIIRWGDADLLALAHLILNNIPAPEAAKSV